MSRRAFTTIELMVALLLAAIIMTLAWDFFIGERRRFESDQDRLSGLQGSMRFDELLAADLERLAVDLPLPGTASFNYDIPVDTGDGRMLAFLVADKDDPADPQVKAIGVVYRFDPASGQVLRSVDGQESPIVGLLAEDLQFQVVHANVQLPAGLLPLTGDKKPIQYVRYTLSCIPESQRYLPKAERAPQRRITLVGAVALRPRSERIFSLYWRLLRSERVRTP